MKYKYHLIYSVFALFCLNITISSQNKPDSFKVNSVKIGTASDTLFSKSFKELKADFYKAQQDSSLSKLVAKYYVLKAKKLKDTAQIANGYYLISKTQRDTIALKYIDSMIKVTENIPDLNYPARGYIAKGNYYADIKYYNLALKNYLIAKKKAISKNNEKQLFYIDDNVGLLKKVSGSEKEALKIFRKNLSKFSTPEIQNNDLSSYLNTLFAISDTYLRLKQPDSAVSYIEKGLEKSIKHERQYLYNYFLLLNGIQNRMQGNYPIALDSLLKAEKIIYNTDIKDVNDLQIAKVLLKLKRDKEALIYLKNIDSVIGPNNFSYDKSDALSLLINHYKNIGDSKNQLKTLNKFIRLDSLFKQKNKNISANIVEKYDTAILIEERDILIEDLEIKKSYSYLGIFVLIVLTFILTIILLGYHRKQKQYKERFEELINSQKEKTTHSEKIINDIELPEELTSKILEGLTHFEKRKGYLESDIKMNTIAKKIQTNVNYLSRVINTYKKKNFTNYINDLRIEYCVEKLTTDSTFRKYSIKAIGEEAGFSSTQSFSRAFYKKTGLQPSYFLKNLK